MMRTFAIGFGDFTHYFNFHWASIFYLFEALTMPPVEVSIPDTERCILILGILRLPGMEIMGKTSIPWNLLTGHVVRYLLLDKISADD
jgi:hypothetical protein